MKMNKLKKSFKFSIFTAMRPAVHPIHFEPVTPDDKQLNNQHHSETLNTSRSPEGQERDVQVVY
jgi:hypothetical protein